MDPSSPEDPNPPPPPLDYERRPALAWVSRHHNPLIALALVLAVGLALWWYWPPLTHRILWIHRSHLAAKHVMPAGLPVSVVGPEAAGIPTTNPDYLPYSPLKPNASTQPSASYFPVVLRHLGGVDARVKTMINSNGPVIFIGTMNRPDGLPRLVVITGGREMDSRSMLQSVGAVAVPLPGWFDPLPPITAMPLYGGGRGTGRPPEPAEYLTGSLDPSDANHVVIPYLIRESSTAVARRIAPMRVARRGSTTAPMTLEESMRQPALVIGQGLIDVRLQNDDSLRFTLRGPGGLAFAQVQADPATLQQTATAAPSPLMTPGRGATTRSARAGAARSRGRSGGD